MCTPVITLINRQNSQKFKAILDCFREPQTSLGYMKFCQKKRKKEGTKKGRKGNGR